MAVGGCHVGTVGAVLPDGISHQQLNQGHRTMQTLLLATVTALVRNAQTHSRNVSYSVAEWSE
jgi:hypothetical protein